MPARSVVIPKVWRSEIVILGVFFVTCVMSMVLSSQFPWSVVQGEVVRLGDTVILLSLPLFWLMPCAALGTMLYRIFNVRYAVDSRFIESRIGVLAFRQKITRVRYEDVRSIETSQSVLGRLLDVGDVNIGTAASGEIEVVLQGVGAPKEVQEMIQNERDRRLEILKRMETGEERLSA